MEVKCEEIISLSMKSTAQQDIRGEIARKVAKTKEKAECEKHK